MSTRRTFLGRALGACSALFATRGLTAQTMQMQMPMPPSTPTPPQPPPFIHALPSSTIQTPVVTTDVGDLACTMDGSTKVYHLVAEVLRQNIHPDKNHRCVGIQRQPRRDRPSRSTRAITSALSSTTIYPSQAPSTGTALKT